MPLSKPYPPTEIDWEDWNDLADNYAGKATTLIVDAGGKGDFSTIQEAVDALPSTNAGEVIVRDGDYLLSKAVWVKDREDLVIRGVGKATRLKVANKVEEAITSDAASGQKEVQVASGGSFQAGQHVCVRDDSQFEVNVIASIDANTLTMEDDLASTYEVADNGRVYTCHSVIWITGTSKNIRVTSLLVDGNRLNQEFGRTGMYPKEHHGDCIRASATTSHITIDHCWVKSAAAHGICSAADDADIHDNRGWDNEYDAINIAPESHRPIVKSNHCWDQASWVGIQIGYLTNPCYDGVVEGNVLYNNRWGVIASGAVNFEIKNNIIKECYKGGVQLYACTETDVEGNQIIGKSDRTEMDEYAILVKESSIRCKIKNNTIKYGVGHAVYVENSPETDVDGNTVLYFNWAGIIIKQGSDDSKVTNNRVRECDYLNTQAQDGIRIFADRVIVSLNRCHENDRYEIHIESDADGTICCLNNCVGTDHLGAIQDDGTNTELAHNKTE
jgi:parallel beta-helix repeat protein